MSQKRVYEEESLLKNYLNECKLIISGILLKGKFTIHILSMSKFWKLALYYDQVIDTKVKNAFTQNIKSCRDLII